MYRWTFVAFFIIIAWCLALAIQKASTTLEHFTSRYIP